ncbi:hypothetical protein GCM10009665_65180 [Kitasatospora nipponensis]|uniref:N-acetyltransferase domain-containing protein n=1 Tax=Kitasatospora nipponensis TaxID=258049 RepID=A0ABN1X1W5_9ACTN
MTDGIRTILKDESAQVSYLDRGRRRAADLRHEQGAGAGAAELVLRTLPGWSLSCDEELGRALLAAGARLTRHGHVYQWDLIAVPPEPSWRTPRLAQGLTLLPVAAVPAPQLDPVVLAAYPVGHPDHPPAREGALPHGERELVETFRGLWTGELAGPPLPGSAAVCGEDGPVAAVVVSATTAGPWITQLLRLPGPRTAGLGTALLRRVLAVAADGGAPSIGLTVTEGNPARARYERIGFRRSTGRMDLTAP